MGDLSSLKIQNRKAAQRVFVLTLGLNLLVSVCKLFWGYYTGLLSVTADGFHSLLDAVANVVGIIGLGYSLKPADSDHPYGHRKFEAIAAIIISFFIFLTCYEIASEAFSRIVSPKPGHPLINPVGYLIMLGTLAVNLGVTWYERRKAKQLHSDLLHADAQHTLSDCLVSVSVIVSMGLMQWGVAWADTALALVVAVIILKVGFDIVRLHLSALADEAVLDPAEIRLLVLSVEGVRDCHKIRSRGMADHIFVDLHVLVDSSLTIKEAHQIASAVERKLETVYEGRLSEVLVHAEEYEAAS